MKPNPRINILSLGPVLAAASLGATAIMLAPQSADASLVMLEYVSDDNDCPGVLGQPFGECQYNGSDVILKYDSGEISINTEDFQTIDGSEFSFGEGTEAADPNTEVTFNLSVGNNIEDIFSWAGGWWKYTPNLGDPSAPVRYWSAKAGNGHSGGGYNIFFYVPDDALLDGGACHASTESQACVDLAMPSTLGYWSTPGEKELSHISFFDSGNDSPFAPPTPPFQDPAPAPLALIALGGAVIGWMRYGRRKG